jgi:release factor glutamine methyltransferase
MVPRSRELLAMAMVELGTAGIENPRLEAEVMLAETLQTSRAALLADGDRVIDGAMRDRYIAMMRRRVVREPLAYIVGHKEFYSLDLKVTPKVLIPRPETETLVTTALEWLAARPGSRLLDLGTGSGAIALAIAANTPEASIIAVDYSTNAVEIARHNASRLGLEKRVVFRHVDCFEILDGGEGLGRFDLLLSNPPYICDADIATLQPEVADWEPRIALAGGIDGLRFYQRIAQGLRDHLAPDACVMIEIGDRQADAVSAILRAKGAAKISVIADMSGVARVIRAIY